ncbi:MAG: helix-turn-helix domain-containing protein, partial [Actinobacteria bacterium]|nr:helix-turn-helix domain-containing protein [Actinomycetota bacterium]
MTSSQRSTVATDRSGVASVAKAAAILHAFSPLTTTLSVRQLAERTAVPRSTVHALCTTLCGAGLLEQVAGRGYQLGPALVTLGGHVIDRTGLVAAAERPLRSVRLGEGQEVHLGQLVGSWVVYLDRRAGPEAVPMRNRVGLRALAHRTGCGKAALAALPAAERRRLVINGCDRDRVARPNLAALDAELDAAAATGYVVSSVFHPGRTSV